MRDKSPVRAVDAAIAAVASRQDGAIAHRQLVALGLGPKAIHRRVQAGRLHRIHQGVYAVGHARLTQRGRWMAAVLAGGEDAVLSHRSAAALWQMLPAGGPIHITTPRDVRRRPGLYPHSQPLHFDEVTTHDGIPVTTASRTLLDIAATDAKQFDRAYNEAEYRRLTDATGLAVLVDRHPARRGIALIRATLSKTPAGITREELERRFHSFVAQFDLPRPQRNRDLELRPGHWIQPDCTWPEARLIVELDGRAAHTTKSRFDSDRERDRLLALAGWTVIRVTWHHLANDADRLAADLSALLARRGG